MARLLATLLTFLLAIAPAQAQWGGGNVTMLNPQVLPVNASAGLPPVDLNLVGSGSPITLGVCARYGHQVPCGLSITRASVKYCNGIAGIWTQVASGALCGTNNGLLVEEARTNSISNNSMQGAVAGTPGTLPTNWANSLSGLTQQIVGTGTESGIDYIDIRLSGTPNATTDAQVRFETTTAVAASNGQTWGVSAFVTLQAGSLTNISGVFLVIQENTAAGAFVAYDTVPNFIPVVGALGSNRQSGVKTLAGGGTVGAAQPLLGFSVTNGSAIDITIRIGWPQLELGASVTSPIRTTNAAATRAADVVTMANPPAFGVAYSLFGKGTPQAPVAYGASQILMQIDDNSNNNRLLVQRFTGDGSARGASVTTGGSGTTSLNTSVVWAQNTSGKIAVVSAAGDQAVSFNGSTATAGAGANLPIGVNAARYGVSASAINQWNGYIERIAIWPGSRLSNGVLQSLTTP